MTTLREEVELIMRRLSGGPVPDDSPYNRNFVAREYRDAMREDCKMEIYRRPRTDGSSGDDKALIGQFIATYKVNVEVDTDSKRVFIAVPDNFLSLKYNKGIYDVVIVDPKATHLQNSVFPVHNPQISSHLPVGDPDMMKGFYTYYLEGLRIFFARDIKRDKIDSVYLKLIVPGADKYGWDDALPVLPENAARCRDIVCERMLKPGRIQQDRIADNNPNLRSVNEQPR
jgi:hypothetical protein